MTSETVDVTERPTKAPASQRLFSTGLVLELARRSGNLFVSPYSVWSLLALLYPGAKGETRDLLASVLGVDEADGVSGWVDEIESLKAEESEREFKTLELKGPRESFPESFFTERREFDLIVANALWLQDGCRFEEEFLGEVRERFEARIEELDLTGDPVTACDRINEWADECTHGRIPTVLSPNEIAPLTRLILSNATYFKDKWLMPFNLADTRKEPFHRLDGSEVEVPMMHQTHYLLYFEDDSLQVVSLLYSHSEISMTIVLPERIEEFEESLTPQSLDELLGSQHQPERVHLALPRYRFEDSLRLIPPLEAVGLGSLFDESADLSGISPEPGIYVDKVKQITFVQVDETGTEAAAVTTAAMITQTMHRRRPPKPKEMIVDRPYWFFIRHEPTACLLFAGRVEDASLGAFGGTIRPPIFPDVPGMGASRFLRPGYLLAALRLFWLRLCRRWNRSGSRQE